MVQNNWKYARRGRIENWHEGLMLGNGNLGALIYGKDRIVFSLDRIDLWDNRLPPEIQEKGFHYQNMVKTMREDWDEYLRLFDQSYNHPYPTKLNAGSIVFQDEISGETLWDLDIKNPHFSIKNASHYYKGYLDANRNVLVIRRPRGVNFSFAMPEYLSSCDENKGLGYPRFVEKKDGDFRYIIQPTKCSCEYGILVYQHRDTLLVTVFKNEDIEAKKTELLEYYENLKNNEILHEKYWKKYYSSSSIVTNVAQFDRTYNFGRYFFACNSKGQYPMSLEGVWTRNDGRLPPWKGDYHMDINLQMSYESYMKTGNFKEGKVLVDFLWKNRGKFKKLAKTFCHSDGYFIPGVMTQECAPLGGWPMYALNPVDGIWISTAFDNYYRYTGDVGFLRKRAYPFFQNVERCVASLLVENAEGHLQLEFSTSPEINDCEKSAILKSQSNFELGLLHYLYRILIEYSSSLGGETSYYRQQQSRLADYAKNEKGETMISKTLEYQVSHRHFSHLLAQKNLENLDPYTNREQILKDYQRLMRYGTKNWVGFSFTEASSFASYIGLGEDAYRHLYAFADAFINDNCFHMNMDYQRKGYSEIVSYAFTLEANMGFVRAISDMMLRTTNGVITIFPAIPETMKKQGVHFKNLRAYGNQKVSGLLKDNKLSFVVKLAKPATIKLFNNIGESFTLSVDGVKKQYTGALNRIIEINANHKIEYGR